MKPLRFKAHILSIAFLNSFYLASAQSMPTEATLHSHTQAISDHQDKTTMAWGPGTFRGYPLGNPQLSWLPAGAQPNYEYWKGNAPSSLQSNRALLNGQDNSTLIPAPQSKSRITLNTSAVSLRVNERELPTSLYGNDAAADAQRITLDYDELAAVTGTLAIPSLDTAFTPTIITPIESDDTPASSTLIDFSTPLTEFVVNGSLNDGALSGIQSDFDIYQFDHLNKYLPVYIEYTASAYDAAFSVGTEDLSSINNVTPLIASLIPIEFHLQETLFLAIGGGDLQDEEDFTVPGSRNGISQLDSYSLRIYQPEADLDFYEVYLEKGDVLALSSAQHSAILTVESPSGDHVSAYNSYADYYPAASPAISTGRSNIPFIATESGHHRILVSALTGLRNAQAYEIFMQRSRPASNTLPVNQTQTVFLDFDGETLNGRPFNGINQTISLSPLADFMENFGFTAEQESVLIDKIVAKVTEQFAPLVASNDHALVIQNSKDHADAFGEANVSRIIVGGTIAELKVATIGIAQSIDPGNFDQAETGVVLLDLLSGDANEYPENSLNNIQLGAGVEKIDLIATALGTIVAHELGHILSGNHTNNENSILSVMDEGGDLGNHLGLGDDEIFGTTDDVTVMFMRDTYSPSTSFLGVQDTANQIANGLQKGTHQASSRSNNDDDDSFLGLGQLSLLWLSLLGCLLVFPARRTRADS